MSKITNGLTNRLLNIEREMRAIKTAYSKVSSQTEITELSLPEPGLATNKCCITYGEGDGPIMSEFYCDGAVTTLPPDVDNNTQIVYFSADSPEEIKIISNRPIIKVEQIPD